MSLKFNNELNLFELGAVPGYFLFLFIYFFSIGVLGYRRGEFRIPVIKKEKKTH